MSYTDKENKWFPKDFDGTVTSAYSSTADIPARESILQEAGCDFCRDEQGYTIGNMYVCDKCGRQVP